MALKKEKRPLEESRSQNGTVKKASQTSVKKMKTEKSAQKPVQSNGVQNKKIAKTEKPKVVAEQTKKIKKEIPAVSAEDKTAAKRLKNAKKLEKKNANRKEARKEQGQYKVEKVMLSPAAIEVRIREIESRPELTKTAKRRLGVLKKKLRVAQGIDVEKPKPVDDDPKLSKATKQQLRETNNAKRRQLEVKTTNSEKLAKLQALGKSNKKGAAAVVKLEAQKEQKIVKVAVEKPKRGKAKEAKKLVVKKEESEDSDEEDIEEEEKEEDTEHEMNGSFANATAEDDDDDDEEEEEEEGEEEEEEDEEEEEEEEEEKETRLPAMKIKQEQEKTQPPKKKLKSELIQNDDATKKKRYVLFVGNLPYDASPEVIKKHFLAKVSAVSSVRVPTRPGSNSPRGFAYVELENSTDYEKALSLHNTILNGRKLNVEYTKTGSKPMGGRQNVVAKNHKLHAMRKQGMLAGSQKSGAKRQRS